MSQSVVIDELHLTVRIPAGLPDEAAEGVRRALLEPAFLGRLRAAIRAVVRGTPELTGVRLTRRPRRPRPPGPACCTRPGSTG